MSTRRDRAAWVIERAIWGGAIGDRPSGKSYGIADAVLAEVDRIPDVSEVDTPALAWAQSQVGKPYVGIEELLDRSSLRTSRRSRPDPSSPDDFLCAFEFPSGQLCERAAGHTGAHAPVDALLLTPDEWCRREGIEILDADGWQGKNGRPWTDAIPRTEFLRRAVTSTQRFRMEHQSEGTAGEAASPLIGGSAVAPPAASGDADPRTPVEAGEAAESARATAALPSVLPRPFLLWRHRDVTGLSGTGVVAWGCEWPDKTVSLRWATEHPSTVYWHCIDELKAVHGHGGETVVAWLQASLIPGEV